MSAINVTMEKKMRKITKRTKTVSPTEPKLDVKAPYCVIGKKITAYGTATRTWFDDPNRAVSHAKNLISKDVIENQRKNNTDELYVVKIIRVIKRKVALPDENFDLFLVD
jgi:hypothetical protein